MPAGSTKGRSGRHVVCFASANTGSPQVGEPGWLGKYVTSGWGRATRWCKRFSGRPSNGPAAVGVPAVPPRRAARGARNAQDSDLRALFTRGRSSAGHCRSSHPAQCGAGRGLRDSGCRPHGVIPVPAVAGSSRRARTSNADRRASRAPGAPDVPRPLPRVLGRSRSAAPRREPAWPPARRTETPGGTPCC